MDGQGHTHRACSSASTHETAQKRGWCVKPEMKLTWRCGVVLVVGWTEEGGECYCRGKLRRRSRDPKRAGALCAPLGSEKASGRARSEAVATLRQGVGMRLERPEGGERRGSEAISRKQKKECKSEEQTRANEHVCRRANATNTVRRAKEAARRSARSTQASEPKQHSARPVGRGNRGGTESVRTNE